MTAWARKLIVTVPIRKVFTFLAVGGTAAGAYSLLCTLLVYWFPAYKFGISIGVHACLIPIAFIGQKHLTFRSSGSIMREFFQYALLQLASITTSASMLVWLVSDRPLVNLFVFLLISGCASIISFLTCNFVIFRGRVSGS